MIKSQIVDLKGMPPIEKEHVDNNLAIMKMLIERGIKPEELPPTDDVKKIQRKLNSEDKKLTLLSSTTSTLYPAVH